MKSINKKHKKILIISIALIVIFFIGKIIYACTYVGDILVTYPWDDYKLSEKIASIVTGLGKSETRQELYDTHMISDINEDLHKFNDNYINAKELGESGQNDNYEKMLDKISTLNEYDITQEVNKGHISYSQGEKLKTELENTTKKIIKENHEKYSVELDNWENKHDGLMFLGISGEGDNKCLSIMLDWGNKTDENTLIQDVIDSEKDEFRSKGIEEINFSPDIGMRNFKWDGTTYKEITK